MKHTVLFISIILSLFALIIQSKIFFMAIIIGLVITNIYFYMNIRELNRNILLLEKLSDKLETFTSIIISKYSNKITKLHEMNESYEKLIDAIIEENNNLKKYHLLYQSISDNINQIIINIDNIRKTFNIKDKALHDNTLSTVISEIQNKIVDDSNYLYSEYKKITSEIEKLASNERHINYLDVIDIKAKEHNLDISYEMKELKYQLMYNKKKQELLVADLLNILKIISDNKDILYIFDIVQELNQGIQLFISDCNRTMTLIYDTLDASQKITLIKEK